MPVRIVPIFLALVLALPMALSGAARADGCYIPEKAVQKLPEIPAQRALVAFKDGKETLIVESELQGQGRHFGWIVPVPARPDSIEAATPGTLKSLAMGIQAEIVHDVHGFMLLLIPACVIVLVFVIAGVRGGFSSLLEWTVVVLIILVLWGLLLPASQAVRTAGVQSSGVTVLQRSTVGSYEITVLSADDAKALYGWLKSEDLAVPQALRPAVEDYVRRGWKFVTARLVTDGAGAAIPHPLRIAFRSKEAVYPMKLTGLSGRTLDLELYVVGEGAAGVPGMRREFCDRFTELPEGVDLSSGEGVIVRTAPGFVGEGSHLKLGHPGFTPAMWSGCWVSKLTGSIPSAGMDEDYVIAWSRPAFERRTIYSHRGASTLGFVAGFVAFTLMTLFAFIAGRVRGWSFSRHAAVVGGGVLLAAAVYGAFRLGLPQTEVQTISGRRLRHHSQKQEAIMLASDVVRFSEDRAARKTAAAARLKDYKNFFTGEPIREEDSPGNYTIAERDGWVLFSLYDLGGAPVTVEVLATDAHR